MVQPRCISLFLLLAISAVSAAAQPSLPDMAGNEKNGSIFLSWQCRFRSVKAISVFRSQDTMSNFTLIGFVKNTKKGVQAFRDDAPRPGRNCYQLAVEYQSGLIWRSNRLCITYQDEQLESQELQRIRTNEPVTNPPATRIGEPLPADGPRPELKMPPIVGDTVPNAVTFIKPRFLSVDPNTGNLYLFLPGETIAGHYSIQFFDLNNNLLTAIPELHHSKTVFDRRNFQGQKVVKFKLRKDGVELEGGYIRPVASDQQ